jgi:hypothetical protein
VMADPSLPTAILMTADVRKPATTSAMAAGDELCVHACER